MTSASSRSTLWAAGLDAMISCSPENFAYLTGFDPRFEEALLVVGDAGEPAILVGNECFGMAGAAPLGMRRQISFEPEPVGGIWSPKGDVLRIERAVVLRRRAVETVGSVEALLEASDVISLHVPMTEKTKNVLSRESIAKTTKGVMIINAARLLRDRDVVFVGVGQPNLACNLAKRTHAPNLVMIYEAGVIGAEPARLPLSIGDPTLVSGSLSVVSMYDIFANYLQRGNVDVGFMGGAQIDRYGNINATVIGGYDHPKVRLPGSGGSPRSATICLTPASQ